jgi:uncharacterized protein YidB (DUF937 family)
MTELRKLATLLDDPESRELIFAVAGTPAALHAMVVRLALTTDRAQYGSWLADDEPNQPMTTDQVRAAFGDPALNDLAYLAGGSPAAVTWQLASILPDLVDAVTPGGVVLDQPRLALELDRATAEDDRESGIFAE